MKYSTISIANAISCTYLLRSRPSYRIGFQSLLQDSLKLQPLQLLTILRVDLTDCYLILSPDGDVHLIVKSCLQLPAVRWKISKVTINWLLCTFIKITETYRSVRLEYFCIPFTRRIFLSILMSGRQMPRIWRALCWSRRWYIRVCASFVSIAFTSSVSSWPSRFSSVTVSAAARCIAIVATSYMIIIH